jgi:GT2 family glycosyltransferase
MAAPSAGQPAAKALRSLVGEVTVEKNEPKDRADRIAISIVTVSFNTVDVLDRCLRAVRASEMRLPIEVIVIDNNSWDGSADRVASEFPEVKLIRNGYNAGFAKACNQGIRIAAGRYILLLNSDVEVSRTVLEKMVEFMDAHPETGIAGCKLENQDGSIQASVRDFPSLRSEFFGALLLDRLFPSNPVIGSYRKRNIDWKNATEVDQVSGAFFMVRREAMEQAGILDERFFIYYEEVDWCLRIKQAGWSVMYVPQCQALHHGGCSANQFKAFPYIEGARSKIQYFRKHSGAVKTLVVQMLATTEILVRVLLWMGRRAGVLRGTAAGKSWSPLVAARIFGVIWFRCIAGSSGRAPDNA